MNFDTWCTSHIERIGRHPLTVLSSPDHRFDAACHSVLNALPSHYASEDRIAHVLRRFRKHGAAQYLQNRMPESKRLRSGELGEILATEYIHHRTRYLAPIKRLRWKEHRETPMRGDDVIGIQRSTNADSLRFLKTEAKSRRSLSPSVVTTARHALDSHSGLPSPPALSYVADRLYDIDNESLADAITQAQLETGIPKQDVEHLLFTFSGNRPDDLLRSDLVEYTGPIRQNYVGIHISRHQELITHCYTTTPAIP